MMKAMKTSLARDEAAPILRKAADQFQAATCNSLVGWGNVHLQLASNALEKAIVGAGKERVSPEALAPVYAEYNEAEKRYMQVCTQLELLIHHLYCLTRVVL
jgi:hypothetical protein